jgi:plastocyanin
VHRFALLLVFLALLASCSGQDMPLAPTAGPPTGANPDPPPSGQPPAGPPTITVTAGGFSPLEVTIAVGGTVRLVNDDTRPHDLMGGLEPLRPECPEITSAGFLTPGQSREAGPFTTARVCRFHSHAHVGIPAFQGTIVIQ